MNRKALQRIMAILFIVMMLVSCAPKQATTPDQNSNQASAPAADDKSTDTVTVAIRNADYDTLDPHVSSFTQAAYVFKQIFDKLIFLDGEKKVPGLALSWEPSEDYKVWTLKLREGVKFHDGSPFNAEVVAFNFDRMVDPATQSKQAVSLIGPYEKSEVVDEYTVKVHFKEPFAFFPNSLGSDFLSMVSMKAVKEFGSDKFFEHLVGTGPFKFVSETRGTEVVLERNPDYNWAPEIFEHQGPAYINKLVFRFITEDETRLGALESGEVQIVDTIPPTRVEDLKGKGFTVAIFPRFGLPRMLNLNVDAFPTDDVKVRQAMNFGVDRKRLDEAVNKGIYPLAYNILAPGTPFYDEAAASKYPYDPEKAKKLLEEAGWTEINADGYRVKDGKVLEVFHATFPDSQAELTAEVVQSTLKEIGIKFNVEVMTGSAMMDGIMAKDSKINSAFIGEGDPDPGFPLKSWFHSSGYLFSHYSTPELDKLLEAGLATDDNAKRAEVYSEVQNIVMDNALVVPLSATVMLWGTNSKINGFSSDPYPHPYLYDTWMAK